MRPGLCGAAFSLARRRRGLYHAGAVTDLCRWADAFRAPQVATFELVAALAALHTMLGWARDLEARRAVLQLAVCECAVQS